MNINLKKIFSDIFQAILAILFPIECLGCHKESFYLCDDCLKNIPVHQTIEPFDHPLKYLDGVLTATDYKNELVQKAIHCFKFRFLQELAQPLSRLLINYFQQIKWEINDLIIMPVPLNKKRYLERGFNQAELIAQLFAEHFGLMMQTDAIERCRNTSHQVGLNKEQRKTNIQSAFKVIKPDLIKNKNIILIDDVVTTGSTLEEIAKVLKKSGAGKVYGLAVAKD